MRIPISVDALQKCLSYCPDTGILTWRVRRSSNVPAGSVAGTNHRERLSFWLDGQRYMVHRAVWAIFYGEWPDGEIDHINCNAKDNRIVNLRVVSKIQNQRNKRPSKVNTTGFKGVYFNKRDEKYYAEITTNGTRTFLGAFAVATQAHEAYKSAAKELHGEYARSE